MVTLLSPLGPKTWRPVLPKCSTMNNAIRHSPAEPGKRSKKNLNLRRSRYDIRLYTKRSSPTQECNVHEMRRQASVS